MNLIPKRLKLARKVNMLNNGYQQNRLREQIARDEQNENGIDYSKRFQFLGDAEEDVNRISWIEWARKEESRPLLPDTLEYTRNPFKIKSILP